MQERQTVFGVLAARMWLGTPGDSELVSHTIGVTEEMSEEEIDAYIEEHSLGWVIELGRQIHLKTGLMCRRDEIAARTEWMWGVVGEDGTELEAAKRFAAGELEAPKGKRAREMTLSDIKERAELWKRGAARGL
jgi:hypothetical protein